jgi:hypothetical protein
MAKWTPEQLTEAREIVARLQTIQEARKLSDRALVDNYPDLGSPKTWRQRLVTGTGEGINPERTLAALRRIRTIIDGGTPEITYYPEMPFAGEVGARLTLLERSLSDRRILVVLAPNGCGKTTFARWATSKSRTTRAYCRLRPGWKNREVHICNGIAKALGENAVLNSAAEAEERLVSLLSGEPKTLFLDQAHEGGAALMHLLRVLVDETPSRFVYLGYDTAFARVRTSNSDAMIEAQAFLGRCQKPILDKYRDGVGFADIGAFITLAGGVPKAAAGAVAQRLTKVLQHGGNLRLLDDAIMRARASSSDDEVDPETLIKLCYQLANQDPSNVGPEPDEEAA